MIIPIVDGLGENSGDNYEIVLHDISNFESSIVAI
jgi:predicted transcriptional regulator YheO